jgi:hypothetical protein
MRHSIGGEIWRGASESLQERVQKELQTTITGSITRDGMGQDKTVRVNGKTVCYHLGFNSPL